MGIINNLAIPVAARSEPWRLRSLACWDAGPNPHWGHRYHSVVSVVCRGRNRGLCVGLITYQEEYYRVWCV